MALLNSCRQVALASRTVGLQSLTLISRGLSSEPPSTSAKESSEIIAPEAPRDVLVADVISGAPGQPHAGRFSSHSRYLAELRHRPIRIFQATRNTMQSGSAKSEQWRIDFDILQGGGRWENPLMGYASS